MIWLIHAALAGNAIQACEFYQPIGGTAGFANGLAAVRTNATTYGAGAFARRRLRGTTYMAMDFHWVGGAAQVPSWCSDTEGRYQQEVIDIPLDLAATNLGLNIPYELDDRFHTHGALFYAGATTTSVMGQQFASYVAPMFNLYPAAFAPLVGRSNTGRSLNTYAVDYIAGGTVVSDIISLQAGYTGTRGLYLDVSQDKAGIFVNSVIDDGFNAADLLALSYLIGGVERFDPLNVGVDNKKVGMSSLFYRDLPQADADEEGAAAPEAGPIDRLRTGHLRQEDMMRVVDVATAVQFGKQAGIREFSVAVHSEGFHERKELDDGPAKAWYVRAGMINLPDQPTLGVRGGIRPTLRADWLVDNDGAVMSARTSIQLNDPELLDLYPFATNALGVHLEMSAKWD
jgi:hypothetical protein